MSTWQLFEHPHDAGRAMHGRNEFDRPGEGVQFSRRLRIPQVDMAPPIVATIWLHHATREPVWLQLEQAEFIAYLARRRRGGGWVERLWDCRGDPYFGLRQVDRLGQLWAMEEYPSITELLPTCTAQEPV